MVGRNVNRTIFELLILVLWFEIETVSQSESLKMSDLIISYSSLWSVVPDI